MFNYRYAFTTFTIVALLMFGYDWGFNTIHHEKQVFVFREVLQILYDTRDKEIQYLNFDMLRSKVKSFSFKISCQDMKYFDMLVSKNRWKKLKVNEYEEVSYIKNGYMLICKYGLNRDTIYCSINYRGEDE